MGSNLNRWLSKDDDNLKMLLSEQKTIKEIAQKLYRSLASVGARMRKLNLKIQTNSRKAFELNRELEKENKFYCGVCDKIYEEKDCFQRECSQYSKYSCKVCNLKSVKKSKEKLKSNKDLDIFLSHLIVRLQKERCSRILKSSLTLPILKKQYNKQNGQCFYSGQTMELKTCSDYAVSIDRIDSSLDYIPENIVLCCQRVNFMKNDLSTETFINFCKKIVEQRQYKLGQRVDAEVK